MKPISLLTLLLFLYLSIAAQNTTTIYLPKAVYPKSSTLKQYGITRELIYRYKANNAEPDSTLAESLYYDSTGKLIERRIFSTLKPYAGTSVYFYNADNKLIKEINYYDTAKTSIKWSYAVFYESNAVSKYNYSKDTTRVTVQKEIYNEKKQLIIEWTKLDNNSAYISRRHFYNERGWLAKTDAYDAKGKHIYSYKNEYDESTHTESLYLKNGNGKNLDEQFIYNDNKQLIQHVNYHKNNPNYKRLQHDVTDNYIYLSNGLLFSVSIYTDAVLDSFTKHFYF